MSKRPKPTTVRPITVPLENATFRPLFKLFWAPLAVLELAYVAIFIPINPESPEKNPPDTNANGTNHVRRPNAAITQIIISITIKKIPTVLYCLFKYAIAPFLILAEIFAISFVPSGCFLTQKNLYIAKARPHIEAAKTIHGAMSTIPIVKPPITTKYISLFFYKYIKKLGFFLKSLRRTKNCMVKEKTP